ncbi:MAG TPA: carbamoyltransferase [Pelolinea sp.]|nr:carbamoyltransferase [Pelolinea sp.]
MYILGISCFYHDSAAVLLKDGELVAAAEEERFSRKKHDFDFPKLSIDFCLKTAGINTDDLEFVAFYEKPIVKLERILTTALSSYPRSWKTFGESMITWWGDKLWMKSIIMEQVGISPEKIIFSDHHMSHAASALFASPFEDSAILTIDGVGEWTTATMGHGKASWEDGNLNEIKLSHEQRFPHSLGLLYSAFTAFLGFTVNEGEYKVMGMAPYGDPNYIEDVYKLIKIFDDGSFWLDMDYFSFHYSLDRSYNSKFIKLFGNPRVHEEEFLTSRVDPRVDPNSAKARENQHYADIAASIQWVTEEVILKLAKNVQQQTGSKNLCYAGGVALNSKANGRILSDTPFERVFIQPAAGDSGGALGAALYVHHILLSKPRSFVQEHNFWGASYSNREINETVKKSGFHFEEINDDEKLIQNVVNEILQGKVIGWFQGRFEWGPRALGNRSIIADPRKAGMKDIVNSKIKFREPFRPFAPVVLEEQTARFFPELKNVNEQYLPRFMLAVYEYDKKEGTKVPAVNHMGTGRLQTIRKDWNPRYYRLVELFGQSTGVPVLMNTSFNLRGEPIVNTPANALNTFSNSGIDTLVLENHLVRK